MNWIDKRPAELRQDELQEWADSLEELAAARVLDAEIPEYIRQLGIELAAMVTKLSKLGLAGTLTDDSQEDLETRCSIHLRREGDIPRCTYVHIFHSIGSRLIRCQPMSGEAYELRLGVQLSTRGRVEEMGAYCGSALMKPYALAEFILQRAVKLVM